MMDRVRTPAALGNGRARSYVMRARTGATGAMTMPD